MKPFVILSAFRAEFSQRINLIRHEDLSRALAALDHYAPKLTLGAYKECGREAPAIELGFRLTCEPDKFASLQALTLDLARKWGQEAFLAVDDKGQARLIYTAAQEAHTVPHIDLGAWTAVPQAVTRKFDCWTHIGGEYYVTC